MKFGIHSTEHPPHIASIAPPAALPGGGVEVHGHSLVPEGFRQPVADLCRQRIHRRRIEGDDGDVAVARKVGYGIDGGHGSGP